MVNSMVERATSSMLIGPDWSMNTEICDICNHDPAQTKDVVKGIKKRLRSKNPKAQLLALTLLETMMKNCGDFVHMHVAERDVLHQLVKIVKKKPDFHVKEKILILIDTWQEAFGGARARYPQYYAAYHELLRLGAVFPQRSNTPAPVVTNSQTQSRSSSYANYPDNGNEEPEFPTLSLTELQNARGIMDVLAEMLTAIDPEKKEGLKQETLVDLVEQCHAYKKRVVHLVNSTSDESLLCQGLALNDDLQRVLTKHESLVSGTSQKPKLETSNQTLVPVDAPLIDTGDTKQPAAEFTSGTSIGAEAELLAITRVTIYEPSATTEVNPKFDLLSGDDFSSENSLAIVPMAELESSTPVSQHNALALVDMLGVPSAPAPGPVGQPYTSPPQFQQPQNFDSLYQNATTSNTQYVQQTPFNQGSTSSWNGNAPPAQSPLPPGAPTGEGLPLPPWEAEAADDNQLEGPHYSQPQGLQANDVGPSMYTQQPMTAIHLPPMNSPGFYPQQGQQMVPHQPGPVHMYPPQQMMQPPYGYVNYGYGYGYGQQQSIDQRMLGLSLNNSTTVYAGPSMANASYVHVPSGKPTHTEDKLFGDLVDFSKVKPNKS
ncbi:TOM1-like protein 9 [Bidens hawaiensis]|uniref:TOM1-like protein 9 n=1 Tax=Bidens hawaiensis TaxID=980011 RepID=UPI0040492485